jgi:putative transposase
VLWVEIPDQTPKSGTSLGVDIGVHKLIVDSNGNKYGTEFKAVRDKVLRKKPRSKNKRQALRHRNCYINQTVNQLPWNGLGTLGIERLTGLKVGKKRNQSRKFRRQLAPWSYSQVTNRLNLKCEENRVRLITVPSAYTSQRCPICGKVSKDNRKGEKFHCVSCGHAADADHIGAVNVLVKTLATLGSVWSPELQNP